MGSDHLPSNCQTGVNQKISVLDGLQHSSTKSDSFVVDMERFSHLIEDDANPRIMRNLSRKGLFRSPDGKIVNNERDANIPAASPRATNFHGRSTADQKPAAAPHDAPTPAVVHHQITFTNGSTAAAESKSGGKRFSFRRSSPAWIIDPRRILFLFATVSCMGTILLIYFTLSMANSIS